MKERAAALARVPPKPQSGERIHAVEFLLAYERYAIETGFVREVFPLRDFCPLPCAPAFVVSIINIRGRIVSVVDFKKFFELPERGLTELNKVIVISDGKLEFGILADAAIGLREIHLSEIQPVVPTLTGIRAEYLRGVTTDRTIVLDGNKILASKRFLIREESV